MEKHSRVCFRQRHGGGRCAPAPFQPSLRLRFTFPLAEPLTEAVVIADFHLFAGASAYTLRPL
jgi:hypothetical protein